MIKRLIPGSTGWCAHDLENPKIAADWDASHFQILEGVLALTPPGYWDTAVALQRLVCQIEFYLHDHELPLGFAMGVDVIVGEFRVPKADAVYMSLADKAKQLRAKNPRTPKRLKYGRLKVPPTLVIENISKGHESEDRVLKRPFYEEASIPNYWILDVYERSLECLILKRGKYVLDQIGRGKSIVTPKCFPELRIDLAKVWGE
jgi:Uma2 family endonuclease